MAILPKRAGGRTAVTRRQFAVRFVELKQRMEVDIGYTVAVGEHKSFILIQPRSQPFQPATGLGVLAGVNQMNLPIRLIAVMDGCLSGAQIDGDIVIERVEV